MGVVCSERGSCQSGVVWLFRECIFQSRRIPTYLIRDLVLRHAPLMNKFSASDAVILILSMDVVKVVLRAWDKLNRGIRGTAYQYKL